MAGSGRGPLPRLWLLYSCRRLKALNFCSEPESCVFEMKSRFKNCALVLVLVVLLFLTTHAQHVYAQLSIVIDEDGVARVSLAMDVGEGVTNISLPVPPIAPTLEVSSNTSIEWLCENSALHIASLGPAKLNITYIANATLEDGVITLSIATNNTIELLAHPIVVLLTLPQNIINATTLSGNWLLLIFTGPATISYTLATLQTTTPPTLTPTPTPLLTPPQATPTTPPMQSPTLLTGTVTPPTPPVAIIVAVVIAVVVIVAAVLIVLRRRAS